MVKSILVSLATICCAILLVADSKAQGDERRPLVQTAAKSESRSTAEHEPGSSEIREFDVRVDNRLVGTHRLTFKSDGDEEQCTCATDVKVNVIVYNYVYKMRGTEIWRKDRLHLLDVRCEDGGKKRTLSLKTDGTKQEIKFNGDVIPTTATSLMSTAYWRLPPKEIRTKSIAVINTDTGTAHAANFNAVDTSTINAGGRALSCRHFTIDGPSPADLWFDEQDRLAGQKSVEQGHHMELRLKKISIEKEPQ